MGLSENITDLKIITKQEYDSLKEIERLHAEGAPIVFTMYRGTDLAVWSKDDMVKHLTEVNAEANDRIRELEQELDRIKRLPWFKKMFI